MNKVFLEEDRVGNSQTFALYKHREHFKLESMAVSDASSNTSEKENTQLSCTYLVVLTFSSRGLGVLSKTSTCPFTDSIMNHSSDLGYSGCSGTRALLSTGELVASCLLITGYNLCISSSCLGSHAVSRGVKLTIQIRRWTQVWDGGGTFRPLQ